MGFLVVMKKTNLFKEWVQQCPFLAFNVVTCGCRILWQPCRILVEGSLFFVSSCYILCECDVMKIKKKLFSAIPRSRCHTMHYIPMLQRFRTVLDKVGSISIFREPC